MLSRHPLSAPHRRSALWISLTLCCCAAMALSSCGEQPPVSSVASCPHAATAPNPILAENTCLGSADWGLDHPTGPGNAIEAFVAPASVSVGRTVRMYVSTSAPSYTFRIYRMGWYRGLGGRLVYSSNVQQGIEQPASTIDPGTRMVSCSNWHNPVAVAVPLTWISGVYIVKLVSSAGYMRYTLFVVRNDASSAPILFQASVLTYQAYNTWGGYSLYEGTSASQSSSSNGQNHAEGLFDDRAYIVSFDRPYTGYGLGDFLSYEYNLVRWLERNGYSMAYSTDIDTDMQGSGLLHHRLFLIASHDEYWSAAMRGHVISARDAGVSLAFFGADDAYWHVRPQSSPLGPDRLMTCYKRAAQDPEAVSNPSEATVLWRDEPLNKPENALLGAMFGGTVQNGTSQQGTALVLDQGARPFLGDTGLDIGSTVPSLIGGEFDQVAHNAAAPATLSVLAASPVRCNFCQADASGMATANATLYTATSGAKVFDAGTLHGSWGLDADPYHADLVPHALSNQGIQRMTANLMSYLLFPW